jgi:hypothetical protein
VPACWLAGQQELRLQARLLGRLQVPWPVLLLLLVVLVVLCPCSSQRHAGQW